ncbi:hypothetical protein EW093_14830 [Thiospirochaeta perfilievii]|uniref:DMT family transporter n=1 Tax=Thiospirochaeta perfilievii TaxID=252967 RepID=A0A5C1QCS3_9SPIO|nr:DMT family transporter [Thiospirochaeta perfilievii]QEN05913.1 hypothetical protein EW093_14830 [Thiospirochaeta perfilievii]
MNIILTLITGICISLMIFFNGSLDGYIGNFPSLLFIHSTGFILISLSFLKKQRPRKREKKSKWFLLAGVMGIVVVTLNNTVYNMGGVLLTLGGTLAGQVIMASIMELVKHNKNGERVPIGKIISLLLVIPGATIIGLRSNIEFYWIFISWIPGMLVMLQSYMNSQNILSIGFKKTLIIHYGSTLAVLLIMMIFIPLGDSVSKVLSGQVPLQFVIGGGSIAIFIVSVGSYLLLKLKPITYVLLLYTGQLSSAILLDYTTGLPFSKEKFIAMILIICGLFLGEIKLNKKAGV